MTSPLEQWSFVSDDNGHQTLTSASVNHQAVVPQVSIGHHQWAPSAVLGSEWSPSPVTVLSSEWLPVTVMSHERSPWTSSSHQFVPVASDSPHGSVASSSSLHHRQRYWSPSPMTEWPWSSSPVTSEERSHLPRLPDGGYDGFSSGRFDTSRQVITFLSPVVYL